MNSKEVVIEIRENRKEIQKLYKEFYIFKGKAYGFIAVLSIVINASIAYFTSK